MNSKYLEYFLRVAEMGSINKAAVELKLSQPSLSRNILLLEHEMGAELFVRSRSGVTLTESGKLLYEHVRPLLRQLSVLREQIGKMAHGHVAVGVPPSWRDVLTTDFAERILRSDTQIDIRINENVSHILREQLAQGNIDLCVAPAEKAGRENIKQVEMVAEPLALVGGADAELFDDRPVAITALRGLPIVIPARPNAIRKIVEQALAVNGVDLNVAIETDTLSLCLAMASRQAGYTVVPRSALLSNPQFSEVSWAPIADLNVRWALFENPNRSHNQAVRRCRRIMFEIVETAISSGRWTRARRLWSE